jgi:tetratricopeptide (TPR) repeat protein
MERQGRLSEAVAEFTHATELRPDFANAHFFLANALAAQGEYAAAEQSYLEALRHEAQLAGAMAGLGRLYIRTGRPATGEDWLRRALQVEPRNAGIMADLGSSLAARGRQAEALPVLQQAVLADPGCGQARHALGSLLATLGRYDDAAQQYRKACELRPNDEHAFGALAGILERRGAYEQAHEILRPFLEAGSSSAAIALPFADVARHFKRDAEAAAALERALTDPALDRKTRTDIHYRLGKLLDAAADYEGAFVQYRQANRLSHELDDRLAGNDAVDYRAERILQQLAVLDRDDWQALPRAGNRSVLPVLVVGMPRSGTTLVEQILASHPDVHGAGELSGVEDIAQSLSVFTLGYPDCLQGLTSGILDRHAGRHLQTLQNLAPRAARVVDKCPHNFLHLGLFSLLFPAARAIHITRDARDTCLSIYFQIFSPQHAYASDLTRLGRHYRTYRALVQYWNSVLDLPILNIRYEQLLAEPEDTVRSLLEFCDLPWNEGCLKFYETRRDVNTPSYDQVRQPLYTQSVGRWKHYATHIGKLTRALQEGPEDTAGDMTGNLR